MAEVEKQEKIKYSGLIPVFMDIGCATIARSFYAPFRGSKGARSYSRDVLYASLREILSGFSVSEGQQLQPGTDQVYKNISKSQKWTEHTVQLEHGAKGHWLGRNDAKFVMIYFHGGGYIAPSTPGHMKYQFILQKAMRKAGHDFSILSLSYILAPHSIYPYHLAQGMSALSYLIETEKRDPSTILIGGDSAGGNLASEMLLHLARPHPTVPPLSLSEPLLGALLISPWVSFTTTSPSFRSNAKSDYLTVTALERACGAFIGPGNEHDQYSEPVAAPAEWWKDVAARSVKQVMIWGGGGEVLIDGIRTFAATMTEGFVEADAGWTAGSSPEKPGPYGRDRITFIETPRQAHEEMIIDYVLRLPGKNESAKVIEKWLSSVL